MHNPIDHIRIHGREFYCDVHHEAFIIMMLYDRGEQKTFGGKPPFGINARFCSLGEVVVNDPGTRPYGGVAVALLRLSGNICTVLIMVFDFVETRQVCNLNCLEFHHI